MRRKRRDLCKPSVSFRGFWICREFVMVLKGRTKQPREYTQAGDKAPQGVLLLPADQVLLPQRRCSLLLEWARKGEWQQLRLWPAGGIVTPEESLSYLKERNGASLSSRRRAQMKGCCHGRGGVDGSPRQTRSRRGEEEAPAERGEAGGCRPEQTKGWGCGRRTPSHHTDLRVTVQAPALLLQDTRLCLGLIFAVPASNTASISTETGSGSPCGAPRDFQTRTVHLCASTDSFKTHRHKKPRVLRAKHNRGVH